MLRRDPAVSQLGTVTGADDGADRAGLYWPSADGCAGHCAHEGGIYDPTIGRFLQADPFIQAPQNSQNYNRYSYVLNNPMSYTDPSGYFFNKLFKAINSMLGDLAPFVATALMFLPGVGQWAAASMWNAATIGFVSGGIATGSLRGALVGAFSGAAFQQIGAHFSGAEGSGFFAENGFGHIFSHGIAGGVSSDLLGGKFGHRFFSAGITKAANVNEIIGTAAEDTGLRIATAAIIGGTISKVTGGKFGNGAMMAAFAQAFNGEQQANKERAWNDLRERYGAIIDSGNIDLLKNINEASMMDFEQFIDAVKPGGKWDFKNKNKYPMLVEKFGSALMDEFGNVHFGIVAAASQHTLATSLFGAGQVQAWHQEGGNYFQAIVSLVGGYGNLSNKSARNLTYQGWTWGDNAGDSIAIMRGHDYFNRIWGCLGRSCE